MPNEEINPALKKSAPAKAEGKKGHSALEEFFVEALKDIYWAEQQLLTALPEMQAGATTKELKSAIGEHITQTKEHVERLKKVFAAVGHKPEAKKCFAMEGLMKEGKAILEETEAGSMTRDAAIIMAAQKVEHYEIATYGGLLEYAKTMGNNEARGLLHRTLDEEKATDQGLTALAQNGINWSAEIEAVLEVTQNN